MPERKRWRIPVYIAIALFILCIPLLLIASQLTWAVNDLQLYTSGFDKYDVSRDTGFSDEELQEVAKSLIVYFNSGEAGEQLDIFDEREMIHLSDIKGLIRINYHLQEAVCAYIAIFIIAGALWLRRRFPLPLAKMVLAGSTLSLMLIILLGITSLVDFEWLFIAFHQLSFSNDYWILSGYLPRIFTVGFFSDTTLRIGIPIAIESLLLGGITGFFVLRRRRVSG